MIRTLMVTQECVNAVRTLEAVTHVEIIQTVDPIRDQIPAPLVKKAKRRLLSFQEGKTVTGGPVNQCWVWVRKSCFGEAEGRACLGKKM